MPRAILQSRIGLSLMWLAIWAGLCAWGLHFIKRIHRDMTISQTREYQAQRAEHIQKYRDEFSLLEQELRGAARSNATRRASELERVWGGSIAAAYKNPALSLRQALQRAAEASAPSNAFVRVDVDRFTEFTATVDSGETLSTNQMIAFARSFLPLAKNFADAVRFSHRGTLIAELDRQDIEFVEDWTRAPDQRIAMLLPREMQSRITEDPAAIERLRDEQRISQALASEPGLREKTERADRILRQTIQNAYGELTLALESLQKSASFGDVRSLRDLDRCEKELRTSVEHGERARQFWTDPVKEWQRLLEAEGISGELRETLVKSFPAIFRNNPMKAAKVFDALKGETESCRFLLRLLAGENDKWKFSGGGIAFTDDEFARRFERARFQFREDSQATETALQQWHEAIGP